MKWAILIKLRMFFKRIFSILFLVIFDEFHVFLFNYKVRNDLWSSKCKRAICDIANYHFKDLIFSIDLANLSSF